MTMEKRKIDRINELARKAKAEGLSEAERREQKILRDEYRAEFRRSLEAQLSRIEFYDPKTGGAS